MLNNRRWSHFCCLIWEFIDSLDRFDSLAINEDSLSLILLIEMNDVYLMSCKSFSNSISLAVDFIDFLVLFCLLIASIIR